VPVRANLRKVVSGLLRQPAFSAAAEYLAQPDGHFGRATTLFIHKSTRQDGGFDMLLLRCIVIVDGVPFRKHAPVQDARDQCSPGFVTVKHDVLSALHAAQPAANVVTLSTQRRIVGQHPATCFEIGDVTDGLVFAPGPQGMRTDSEQIGFGTPRKTRPSHSLARRSRKVERFANTREHVTLDETTGVTLVNGITQGFEFRLVLLLVALQGPQRRADYLASVFVPATLYLLEHEEVKFVGKIDVASWHKLSTITVP
jgi:hypothetical protein